MRGEVCMCMLKRSPKESFENNEVSITAGPLGAEYLTFLLGLAL